MASKSRIYVTGMVEAIDNAFPVRVKAEDRISLDGKTVVAEVPATPVDAASFGKEIKTLSHEEAVALVRSASFTKSVDDSVAFASSKKRSKGAPESSDEVKGDA